MSIQAAILPGGRLHLNHGPVDLLIGAEGDQQAAFAAARARFGGLLEELVAELSGLRARAGSAVLTGPIARRMAAAVAPHAGFVTPMAAVAGAVADEVLAAMRVRARLTRAWVNNGGDIALHLNRGARPFQVAMPGSGQIALGADSPVRGVATSGRGGRSLSMGIADSVTVLARDAAAADAAATLIANAVDLPGHTAITRARACDLQPDSDLGARLVVTDLGSLGPRDIARALDRGAVRAKAMLGAGLIHSAALFLRGQYRYAGPLPLAQPEESHAHA